MNELNVVSKKLNSSHLFSPEDTIQSRHSLRSARAVLICLPDNMCNYILQIYLKKKQQQ